MKVAHSLSKCGCTFQVPETPQQFATSCLGISPLIWRIPIFLWCSVAVVWSTAEFWGARELWLIYMTHWGMILILFEALLGVIVAFLGARGKLPDAASGLPWYVKMYWVLYNMTIPVAFLITVFYWALLRASGQLVRYASHPLLDVFVHAGNSFVMFIELIFSDHPSRLRHIYQPNIIGMAYLIFGVIYYFAGGVDPWGNHFIYPIVNWDKPQQTGVVVTLTALFLTLMHLVTVAIATVRDFIKCRLRRRGSDTAPCELYNEDIEQTP